MCCLMVFVTMGTVSNGLSIFLPYILKTYSITNAQASSLVTLRCVFAFISMIFIGHYYDAIGFRLGTAVATALCSVAFAIYAIADTYTAFCVGASVSGISYGLGSMIPVSIIMNKWFIKHRALSIGICGAGSGFATIFLPPVITGIIETESMKTALVFVSVYTFIFAFVIFLFLRGTPSDKGLDAYGRDEIYEEARLMNKKMKLNGCSVSSESYSLSRKGWILMGIVSLLMGAMANPGFMHLTVLFSDEGYRPMVVALVISIIGIVMTGFKIIMGHISDRLGGYRTSIIFCLILIIGYMMCCLSFTQSVPLAMVTAAILGIGYPIATIGIPIWAGDMASEDHYAGVVRKLQLTYAAGAMLFANIPGIMADMFGNYISVYAFFALLMVIALIAVIFAYRDIRRI